MTIGTVASMISQRQTQDALMSFAMRAAYHFHGLSDAQYDEAVADAAKRREQIEAEGKTEVPLASKPQIQ
jgi:hypothetical protein